ncbi:MAG TPA: glycosyltransferase family 2 protein [Candidatus Limnocylindria bacterium]|nr:glycosyltransferase family 2 protein [Candidatus Limnocylindria bacterium]
MERVTESSVSVIVSNFNGARYLPRLLKSLKSQRGVAVEIIIVDRHSHDESAAILAGHPDLKVISEPPETGLVSGYHAGSHHASHPLLFFCNEDMWFDPDCLRLLAARIDLSARVGAVDGWHWTYDGTYWLHGATRFVPSRWAINSPHPRRAADFQVSLAAGEITPFPCAGAFLIHRDVYRELGGWDTGFFLDHEDIDLFIRAWQRDWRCVMEPGAKIYHAVNASNNQTLSSLNVRVSDRRYLSQRANLSIIAAKYYSWRGLAWAALVWPAVFLNNIRNGYWGLARRDFRVLCEIWRRLPAARAYRQANAPYNLRRPGEAFFFDRRFSR